MTNLLIYGASRGLGAAFNLGVPERGDAVWLVSRSAPDVNDRDGVSRSWIRADLSTSAAAGEVAAALEGRPIDVAIYNAGIWETHAFHSSYDFDQVGAAETERIVAVNLTSAITCIQKILPNLRKSRGAKVILVGSSSGLDNASGREVAYAATKFGLRGVAHALRENLRRDRIAVTCLNPGNVGSIQVDADGRVRAVAHEDRQMIPPEDLVEIVRCVVRLSNAVCVKEIDALAMTDPV